MGKMKEKQDTFLEGIVMEHLGTSKKEQFGKLVFTIAYNENEVLKFGMKDEYTVTDMGFEQV